MPAKKSSYRFKREEPGNPLVPIGILAVFIIIAVGAIVIVALQGGEEVEPPPITPPDQPGEPVNETNETIVCDDGCLLDKAISEHDTSYCSEIENSTVQQECYVGLSMEFLAACKEVQNDTVLEECILFHATNADDITICEYLKEGILECKGQVDDCYLLMDDERRNCLALKHGDMSACEDDAQCIYDLAMETENSEYCELIYDNVLKYACRSILLGQDECQSAGTKSNVDLCELMLAKSTGEKLTCTMLTAGSPYSLECFSHFAAETGDPGFCTYAGILQLNDLWDCYVNYSLSTEDVAGCELIDQRAYTHKFTCYYEYAKKFGDPAACDLIGDPSQANTCYVGSILDNPNLNYEHCGEVVRESWKNKCYTEYAKNVDDVRYCDYISTEAEQQLCYDSFDVETSE